LKLVKLGLFCWFRRLTTSLFHAEKIFITAYLERDYGKKQIAATP